jgi:hypothetical protein
MMVYLVPIKNLTEDLALKLTTLSIKTLKLCLFVITECNARARGFLSVFYQTLCFALIICLKTGLFETLCNTATGCTSALNLLMNIHIISLQEKGD